MLVPGDYVTVISTVVNPKTYTLVPQVAVLKNAESSYVFMIDDKGLAYVQPVVTGVQIGDSWEVLEGLKEGDKVIVSGLGKVRPGVPVRVAEQQEQPQK